MIDRRQFISAAAPSIGIHVRSGADLEAGRGPQERPPGYFDVHTFGAVGDGIADDTPAIQAAIDAAETVNNGVVEFPIGRYRVTGVLTVTRGIVIEGAGPQGSNQRFGTVIVHEGTSHLFVINGDSALRGAGTGGALKNFLVLKADGVAGGDAIRVIGTDDDHRPGEMILENLLVYGMGSGGLWDRGINIDGTANATPGSVGVRSVHMRKVRVSDCTQDFEYIVINQGTHVTGHHVQVDSSDGTGSAGLTIKGQSVNVNLNALIINGTLVVDEGGSTHVNLQGRVSALAINEPNVLGTAVVSTLRPVVNASRTFRVVSNRSPSFRARRVARASNVTGDGTVYPLTFDVKDHDRNDDFDPESGTFRCSVAGLYTFSATVLLDGLTSEETRLDLSLVQRDRFNGTVHSAAKVMNPAAIADPQGNVSADVAVQLELRAGDTVSVRVSVSNGSRRVGVYGAEQTAYTFFQGRLL